MKNVIQFQSNSNNPFHNEETSNNKIYLDCPFEEKDWCKNLGGQWDPIVKKWFISKDQDQSKFDRWLSKIEEHKLEATPEDCPDVRNNSPLVTGPRILLGMDDNDRTYLKLYFDDNPEIARKMAKGGNWPTIYAERLRSKAAELVETEVYLKTSQFSKAWDPLKWVMDLIPATDWYKTKKVKEVLDKTILKDLAKEPLIESIPSKIFDDNKFCLFDGNQSIYLIFLDEISNSNLFKNPDEFDEFKKYVQTSFESSYFSKKTSRFLPGISSMKRIRIGMPHKSRTKRNGYRLVVSKVDNFHYKGFSIFHTIHLDDKLLNEEFPTDREIKNFKKVLTKCESKYGPETLNQIIGEL